VPDLAALERSFAEVESRVHAFVPEEGRFDRVRRQWEEVGRPLLLVGVKDIFHVDGMPTRAGSRLPPEALAGAEAVAVTRLREADAVVLGKTVSTEFAYFAPGPTRNPHALEHTPGGSSSGSAAAVAAGLCPLALGTQTIGSICRPASYCGVVGFKPSYGRIPVDGVIPLSPSFDHVGFLARDMEVAAVAAAVLCDDWQPSERPGAPRLGLPEGPLLQRASDQAMANFRDTCRRLERAGYRLARVEALDELDEIEARHWLILRAEAAAVHRDWFDEYGELYHPTTAELIELGRTIADDELAAARDDSLRLKDRLERQMDHEAIDLWISPSATGPAPPGLESTGDPAMNLPWTQAGMPAVSLPSGSDGQGLPLGLQLAGRVGSDEELLAWAAEIAEVLEP
jgi:Asp-tRNA(Asn)/Glu-tRNA(Gln) amidotransferase A subunit family amidase